MVYLHDAEVMVAVDARMRRAAAKGHLERRRGLGSLGSITATGALLGFFGTVLGFNNSFGASGASAPDVLSMIFGGLSEAFAIGGLGLAVSLIAYTIRRYLVSRVDGMDAEVEIGRLDTLNLLDLLLRRG